VGVCFATLTLIAVDRVGEGHANTRASIETSTKRPSSEGFNFATSLVDVLRPHWRVLTVPEKFAVATSAMFQRMSCVEKRMLR
jgi:hypothetical protein